MCTEFYHLIVFALAESDLIVPREEAPAGKLTMGWMAACARPPFPDTHEEKRARALP
jgi:hypothetical protein